MAKTDDEIEIAVAKERLFEAADQIVDCLNQFDIDDHIDVANGVNIINEIVIKNFGVYETSYTDTENLVADLEDDELEKFSNKTSDLLDIEIKKGGSISENGVALGVQLGSLFWIFQYGDERGLDEGGNGRPFIELFNMYGRAFIDLFSMYSDLYRLGKDPMGNIISKVEKIQSQIEGFQSDNSVSEKVSEKEELVLLEEFFVDAENSARNEYEGWYYDDGYEDEKEWNKVEDDD